jgi:hypothetical protein
MSVLAEAFSVVVSRAAIDRLYGGGLEALRRDAPAGSFCSDGLIARAGFASRAAAEFFAALLRASGLSQFVRGHAADFVLVDGQSGPSSPCLWLEFGHDRHGIPMCWHATARRGPLRVPEGWEPGRRSLGDARDPGAGHSPPFVTH